MPFVNVAGALNTWRRETTAKPIDYLKYQYEQARRPYRCQKCGSPNAHTNDEYDLPEPCGVTCPDCGFDMDCNGVVEQFAPFIMPGNPGSHDQMSDYEVSG